MSAAREAFEALAGFVEARARPGEIVLSRLSAEASDFIRFNRSLVRQATSVAQWTWALSLLRGQRRIDATVSLTGRGEEDRATLAALLEALRTAIEDAPEDPFLLVETHPAQSAVERPGALPAATEVIDAVLRAGRGVDLVGFYAGGPIHRGFSSSLGVRHWHSVENFSLSWSLYHDRDKAVKTTYADATWSAAEFERRMGFATQQLALLAVTPRALAPGGYRAYLAPAAMNELLSMLSWAGFGLKSRRTKQTALLRMAEQDAALSPQVTLHENTAGGLAGAFQAEGFVRPPRVPLVEAGRLAAPLVSPRSSREYGVDTNGANGSETPESMDLAGGDLPTEAALQALGTGLYIGNLWYLNFSDRASCRMTGMTRFASFWVEGGRIRSPLDVMRFDDTAYRLLGDNLEALTRERDLLPESDTYGERSTLSTRTPGALVRELALTL